MLKHLLIIKHLTLFTLPYIFLYALYIQVNGEISPGGGFQSGVIFAGAIIGFDLVYGPLKLKQYLSCDILLVTATIGVLLYAIIGIISLLFNDNYLNYYSLTSNKLLAQHIGIFTIEIGVGLCVTATMCLIYSVMSNIRLLAEFAPGREFVGDTELGPAAYGSSSEDWQYRSTYKLPSRVELCKKSME